MDQASKVLPYNPKLVEFIKEDQIFEFSTVPAKGTMARKRRPFLQAILTEMRLSGSLKKAAATQAVRRIERLDSLPAGAADNSFAGKFKERRAQLA
jgi:hypothetical protein